MEMRLQSSMIYTRTIQNISGSNYTEHVSQFLLMNSGVFSISESFLIHYRLSMTHYHTRLTIIEI